LSLFFLVNLPVGRQEKVTKKDKAKISLHAHSHALLAIFANPSLFAFWIIQHFSIFIFFPSQMDLKF
jgi:hypothetical protein